MALILYHQAGVHLVKGDVIAFRHETFETVQDGCVPFGDTLSARPFQLLNQTVGKIYESSGL